MADLTPITRKEKYLAKAGGQEVTVPDPPITREEMFLKAIADNSGGTDDYSDLSNKPKINNVTLDGNKSWADLGLSNPMHIAGRVDAYQDLPATANEGDVYLVGLVAATEKEEYVYVSGGWEYLGSNTIEVDSALSTTSENPVQNKVITAAVNANTEKLTGIAGTADNYIEMENGVRLYISDTAPTGTIPEGSLGVGW